MVLIGQLSNFYCQFFIQNELEQVVGPYASCSNQQGAFQILGESGHLNEWKFLLILPIEFISSVHNFSFDNLLIRSVHRTRNTQVFYLLVLIF